MATAASGGDKDACVLCIPRHIKFWKLHLSMLPAPYVRGDDQRMTFAYFCLGALDLLQQMDSVVDESNRQAYIDWVYGQQLRKYEATYCSGMSRRWISRVSIS